MKSYKPLFLFMLSLSLISIAAKAEDAAKPPPPSDQEIADQKNYEDDSAKPGQRDKHYYHSR